MKQRPQERVYALLRRRHGDILTLYGSRVDESDGRAARIAKSCTAAGSECGMGLFTSLHDKLAPLVGWRNCAVWDWLQICERRTGVNVTPLWEAYAADDAEQLQLDWDALSPDEQDHIAARWDWEIDATARTGCVACQIARDDRALRRLSRTRRWGHIAPYQRIIPITEELRTHAHRVQNPRTGGAGALRLESRLWALEKVLAIQAEVRAGAALNNQPHYDLIPTHDEALIRSMIAARTWPTNYKDEPLLMPVISGEPQAVLPGQLELL